MNPIPTGSTPAGKFYTAYTSSVFIPGVNSANGAMFFSRLASADTVCKREIIHTFGLDPYVAVSPIPVTISRGGRLYSIVRGRQHQHFRRDGTRGSCILKDLSLLRYERLRETDDSRLGPHMFKQKRVLVASVKAI